jgi:hypothetical protein
MRDELAECVEPWLDDDVLDGGVYSVGEGGGFEVGRSFRSGSSRQLLLKLFTILRVVESSSVEETHLTISTSVAWPRAKHPLRVIFISNISTLLANFPIEAGETNRKKTPHGGGSKEKNLGEEHHLIMMQAVIAIRGSHCWTCA